MTNLLSLNLFTWASELVEFPLLGERSMRILREQGSYLTPSTAATPTYTEPLVEPKKSYTLTSKTMNLLALSVSHVSGSETCNQKP